LHLEEGLAWKVPEMNALRAAIAWISAPSRRFIPLFLVYLWIFTTLTGRIPRETIEKLLQATAWVDAQLLDLFSDQVRLSGIVVSFGGFSVQIISECTGLFEAVILASAVLAYKATWVERLQGIVFGTLTLYLLNVLRIAFLLIVGRYFPNLFDFAHVYFWQTLLIVFITAIWLAWIHYFVRDGLVEDGVAKDDSHVEVERS
jgi:exosortase H (IPTLxxWG-CTERM-specific)